MLPKLKVCAYKTKYLGYILTRDGIKPQESKVQAILALKPPTNVKELCQFLGMVQYYRNLWAKHSKMLAPLTDLVGECGQTKVTKAKGTKKVPWH
jgi:hypothetical protein